MTLLYFRLAKKSIVGFFIAIFLFFPIAVFARVPNDPQYALQSAIWTQIGVAEAWDKTIGSSNIIVAIIDTGVDIKHPDLATNIWTNQFEIPDNGVDDDGNGFVDDVHGWNFVDNSNDVRTVDLSSDPDPDATRHGTIEAGLIGAVGDNNRDGVGLNWRVSIMPLKAIDNSGSGSVMTVARAIDYASDNGADIISMSFVGPTPDEELHQAILRAQQKGVIIVAAAGNHQYNEDGNLTENRMYPVCYDASSTPALVIGVGSVDNSDLVSRFSDVGTCVDIMAPGENVYSTEFLAPEFNFNEEFGGPWQGTSFATPLVAGAAAIIKSIRPEWGPVEVLKILQQSADSITNKNPDFYGLVGAGRLNIGQAVNNTLASGASDKLYGSLFYNNEHEIWGYDFAKQYRSSIDHFYDAIVVSVAERGAYGEKNTFAALLRRGVYYYVRLMRPNGAMLREFAVAPEESIKWKPKKITWSTDAVSPRLLVEEYFATTKATRLAAYSIMGNRLGDLELAGPVVAWQPNSDGATILTATLIGKKLTVRKVAWENGEEMSKVELNGVDNVEDMRVGNFFGDGNEQAVLLASSGKILKQYIVDVDTQSFRSVTVGSFVKGAKRARWRLFINSHGLLLPAEILRYNNFGGNFGIFTGRGEQVGVVDLPPLQTF